VVDFSQLSQIRASNSTVFSGLNLGCSQPLPLISGGQCAFFPPDPGVLPNFIVHGNKVINMLQCVAFEMFAAAREETADDGSHNVLFQCTRKKNIFFGNRNMNP
jgi:hypothetical protein